MIYTFNIENARQKEQEQFGKPSTSQSEIINIVIAHEVAPHMHVDEYYGSANSAMKYTTYLDQLSRLFPAAIHNREYELTNY